MNIKQFEINGKGKVDINLNDIDLNDVDSDITEQIEGNIKSLIDLQDKLYADGKYSILLIIQALDTAGKDGIVKHVMSGLNPQATQVYSFKQPTSEELNHDFLWKAHKSLPERGHIGIFNRSYYEEVLVVKVHDLIKFQRIPTVLIHKDIFEERYEQIRNFEKMLHKNGTVVIKIFLNISKKEQKERLLERIDDKSKNWKFSESDLKERQFWGDYMKCYEDLINETSTDDCPWYVVPANHKKTSRLIVSKILVERMKKLNLEYPQLTKEQEQNLLKCKEQL
jgi:PPK2 family polyphosphate:nucleotide phosphotransferase